VKVQHDAKLHAQKKHGKRNKTKQKATTTPGNLLVGDPWTGATLVRVSYGRPSATRIDTAPHGSELAGQEGYHDGP